MKKRLFLLALAASYAGLLRAQTSDGSQKSVRFIVPFPPGGAADQVARLLAHELAQMLGRPIVIENKGGAAGNIATREAAMAAPDGSTIFLGTVGTNAINPSLYADLPYDTRKAFVAVAFASTQPNVLVVNANSPVKSLADLTALAKSRPGSLNMGSAGIGSSMHLCGEMYKSMAHVSITHIPYRGGAAALTDLLSGQSDLMFNTLSTSVAHIASGRLRPIAVTGAQRVAQLANVPTMAEAGLPGYEATAWSGIFMPTGVPQAMVDRMNALTIKVLESESVKSQYRELGIECPAMTPSEFQTFVSAEFDKWAKVIRISGAKAE